MTDSIGIAVAIIIVVFLFVIMLVDNFLIEEEEWKK